MLLKCLLYQSSNYNHLWGNGFLRFNNLLLSYLISFYLHVWSSPTQRILRTIFCFTYSRICRGNLLWVFTVCIYKQIFFWICKQILWAKLFHLWNFLYCRDNFGPSGISVDSFSFFFTENFNSHHKTQKKNKLSPFQ